MNENIFTHLTRKTKFYTENQTLELISSIDENNSEKEINDLKNRASPSGWTYEFGYIWYEEGKILISQIDPLEIESLEKYTPWQVAILKSSRIKYLTGNISGRSNRRYIPLIRSSKKNSKPFSIATYREIIDSQQTELGLEKYFYLDAINLMEDYCNKVFKSSPDSIYSSLDRYFEKINERGKEEKYGLFFTSVYEIRVISKLISYIPQKATRKFYTQIFTRFLQDDIRKYYKNLGEKPPKKKNIIWRSSGPLLTPFIEAFAKNSKSSSISETLIYVEDVLSLKEHQNLDTIRFGVILERYFEKLKEYKILLSFLSIVTSILFLTSETNWNFLFLLSIFSDIDASALVPVIILSAFVSAIIIAVTLLLYYVPEKSISISKIFLISLPSRWIRHRSKIFAPILAWAPYGISSFTIFLLLNNKYSLGIPILYQIIAQAIFAMLFIFLGKIDLFKSLQQEPLMRNIFFPFIILTYLALTQYSFISLNIHPVKNCTYVINENRLEYYEYIVLNSWAERSDIAVLKIENFDISGNYIKNLSEDKMHHRSLTIISSEGGVISTPSVINTANNLLPPRTSCPTTNHLPASNAIKSKEYIESLSRKELLYEFSPDDTKFILKESKGPYRSLTKVSNLY